ncbi:coil containing protein [Vibrio phage 1.248.O._10N.261.54.F1]|nr:coil containing protein [Vibrio phage 1.248.O._10N.261.54.F1]
MKMSDKFQLPVFYECNPLSEVAKFSAWQGNGEICKSLFLAFDDCDADLICEAINNHDRMVEDIAELKGAIEAAVRIKELWLPMGAFSDNPPEHCAEIEALHKMANKFERALAKLSKDK